MPWTYRDFLAALLVPLVASLIGSLYCEVTEDVSLAGFLLDLPFYRFAFSHAFPILFGIHLIFQLTLRDVVRESFSRPTLFLGVVGGPAFAVVFGLIGYLAFSLEFGVSLDYWLLVLSQISSHPVKILLVLLFPFGWLCLYFGSAGFFTGLLTVRWAGRGRPPRSRSTRTTGRLVTGTLGLLILSVVACIVIAQSLQHVSQRARCVLNIRNAQQSLRSYQNMYGHSPGDPGMDKSLFVGPDLFLEQDPVCPSGGTYTWHKGEFPQVGTLVLRCSCKGHEPRAYKDW